MSGVNAESRTQWRGFTDHYPNRRIPSTIFGEKRWSRTTRVHRRLGYSQPRYYLVLWVGFGPTILSATDFKPVMYTSSNIRAFLVGGVWFEHTKPEASDLQSDGFGRLPTLPYLVPETGLAPARLSAPDSKSGMSSSFNHSGILVIAVGFGPTHIRVRV